MKPDIITPGQTRVRIRFWAKEPDPVNKPEQYELFPNNGVHYSEGVIASWNDFGAIVLCDANPDLAIPPGWQAIVGWNDLEALV